MIFIIDTPSFKNISTLNGRTSCDHYFCHIFLHFADFSIWFLSFSFHFLIIFLFPILLFISNNVRHYRCILFLRCMTLLFAIETFLRSGCSLQNSWSSADCYRWNLQGCSPEALDRYLRFDQGPLLPGIVHLTFSLMFSLECQGERQWGYLEVR